MFRDSISQTPTTSFEDNLPASTGNLQMEKSNVVKEQVTAEEACSSQTWAGIWPCKVKKKKNLIYGCGSLIWMAFGLVRLHLLQFWEVLYFVHRLSPHFCSNFFLEANSGDSRTNKVHIAHLRIGWRWYCPELYTWVMMNLVWIWFA